jgi:urea carboxylase system permease
MRYSQTKGHKMSVVLEGSSTPVDDLGKLGYKQELHRKVGPFGSFAAGFSFVSILTTVFQLFWLGFGFGGAAFFWTWPAVFAGQLLVALVFSELAARYPISGAIFQWSGRLAGSTFGWFTGWIMIIGQILTVATAAIALQAVLPPVWNGFQIIGGPGADPSPFSATGAANAVLLGILLLVVTTSINAIGVKIMTVINSTGVVLEIVGVVALVTAFFFHAKRGAEVVNTTIGAAPANNGYLFAWLASSLMAAYVMVGFDSAGELSEETVNPRRTAPRTILRALLVSGIGGGLLILAGIMAAPSLTDGNLATGGLPYVVSAVLGPVGGPIMLIDVAIAVTVCTLAVQTSGSRMVYSMAREKTLPFHEFLAKVSPRTGTPINANIVVGVAAALALLVNVGQSALFTALTSLCIGFLYLAYLGVTGPMLLKRMGEELTGRVFTGKDEKGHPLFNMGSLGIAVNFLAVVYQIIMVVNLMWPRPEIYDLTGHTWWLKWSALIALGITLVVGIAIHIRNRAKFGKLILQKGELSDFIVTQ